MEFIIIGILGVFGALLIRFLLNFLVEEEREVDEKGIKEYLENKTDNPETMAHFIKINSKKFGVSEEIILGMIEQESNYRPEVVGGVGEIGLMQISEIAFDEVLRQNENLKFLDFPESLFDIGNNIRVGMEYLNICLNRADGIRQALAYYNGGWNPPERSYNYADSVLNRADRIRGELKK